MTSLTRAGRWIPRIMMLGLLCSPSWGLDVVFDDVPLTAVLNQLEAETGWVLTSTLQGVPRVRMSTSGQPIDRVMRELANQLGAVFERTPTGGVFRPVQSAVRLETRALKHRGADELATLLADRVAAAVIVDSATNRLILEGADEEVRQGLRLIDALDVPVRQILIEAKLVSADTHVRRDLGVRWQFAGGQGRLTGQSGGRALGDDAGRLAVSIVDNPQLLQLELAALEASGAGEVISEPRVVTTNRRQATIRQGQQVPFVMRDKDGVTQTEFKDAVLELNVTPVLRDDGRIELTLNIRQDQVSALATDAGPAIETRELDTEVTVAPNETLVLGGIYESREQEVVTGLPGLSQLPMIGRAFQTRERRAVKSELLLFITPRLL